MGDIAAQSVDLDGLKPTYVAAVAAGDKITDNDGHTILHVKNGGGSACVVTIDSVKACDQGSDHNEGGSVPAGEDWFFGPFLRSRFNDSGDDVVITYDQVTTVTIAALRVT